MMEALLFGTVFQLRIHFVYIEKVVIVKLEDVLLYEESNCVIYDGA